MEPGLEELAREIDRKLSERWIQRSDLFWTPVEVTARGVAWLDEVGAGPVMDLGSGVGKWCVAAARLSPGRRYVGVEHRADLVRVATSLARDLGVADRVAFHHAAVHDLASMAHPELAPILAETEAFYLFNPFGEHLAPDDEHLDEAVAFSEDGFRRDVAATRALLSTRPPGTFVLVYNGFGGAMPEGYEPVRSDLEGRYTLRLWLKR